MLVCACRTRSTDHQRVQRYAPFHSTAICARLGIRDSLWMFFAYKKNAIAELRCELVTGCTARRYDQFETSPEAIEQELRPAVCERRQTDRLKANYSIDIQI